MAASVATYLPMVKQFATVAADTNYLDLSPGAISGYRDFITAYGIVAETTENTVPYWLVTESGDWEYGVGGIDYQNSDMLMRRIVAIDSSDGPATKLTLETSDTVTLSVTDFPATAQQPVFAAKQSAAQSISSEVATLVDFSGYILVDAQPSMWSDVNKSITLPPWTGLYRVSFGMYISGAATGTVRTASATNGEAFFGDNNSDTLILSADPANQSRWLSYVGSWVPYSKTSNDFQIEFEHDAGETIDIRTTIGIEIIPGFDFYEPT